MALCRNAFFSVAMTVLVAVMVSAVARLSCALALESPSNKPVAQEEVPVAGGMGRLYIFRPVRSFGAHIDANVTVDGIPVHRVAPGSGFYCDLPPRDYVISVAGHTTSQLEVSVAPGQASYVCVMLQHQGGVSPRGGALTSDQSFVVRRFGSDDGALRAHEYPLTRQNCKR